MSSIIVLAMHGMPPRDLPQRELAELFGLHARLEHPENDPFFAGSMELADHLHRATGVGVVVGFNEFCAPSLDEALDEAASRGAGRITVLTPMMTRGGEHSEIDIPAAIRRAQDRHPGTRIDYVWPFDPAAVAEFLAAQMARPQSVGMTAIGDSSDGEDL